MTFSRKGREKKGWKAFQADYDYVFSLSDRECCYSLTDQQVAALLAMTEFLAWPTRWVKETGDVDRDIITKFTDGLERNLMSGCCDDNLPIQYRYSPEGKLQRSLNAGGNWTDAPEYDPRVYSPQFPPMPGDDGDDKKCLAAAGAVTLIKEQVGEQLTDDMTRYTLAQLITDWTKTYIGTSNPLEALLTVLANQIFALVIAVLRPALTDPVYDTLQCILYCHIGDDATVNDVEWQAIRGDITSKIGGIAGVFFEHLVYLLGTGGLTNLIRAGGAAEADCSDCECEETCAAQFAAYIEGEATWGVVTDRGDDYVEIEASFHSPNYYAFLTTDDPDTCCLPANAEVISGTVDVGVIHWNLCGETGFGNHGGLFTYGATCVNWLAYQSGEPFKVKVIFADCP